MITRCSLALLAGTLFIADIQAQPQNKPRTDFLGDPLPDGAIARLGTVRFKHNPAMNTTIGEAFFSPDGTRIVSLALNKGSIRLWNAASGMELKGPWAATTNNFSAVAFSPDGKLLAAAINPGFRPNNLVNDKTLRPTVMLYDIAAAAQLKTLAAPTQLVHALGFAEGGKTLVAAGDGIVRWWDLHTGKEQRSWKPFPDEKAKDQANAGKTKTFSACALSPEATFIALEVDWRSDNRGRIIQRLPNSTVEKEAIGYDLAKGGMRWHTFGKGAQYQKGRFAFSADGKSVAIALGLSKMEVRNTITGKLVAAPFETNLAGNLLGGVALSADGSVAALASADSTVQLWNIKDTGSPRQFVARLAQNGLNATSCLNFSPNSDKLLVGVDADLQIYDVATCREVRPWEGQRGWVDHLTFTPDGKRLVTGTVGGGASSGDYFGPNGQVYFLVSGGNRREAPAPEEAMWDAASWKRLHLTSVRTSPWPNLGSTCLMQSLYSGKTGEDRFGLYDLKSGQLVGRMLLPTQAATQGTGFFTPGGKRFVWYVTDNRGTSELIYAVPSGKLVCRLPAVATTRQRFAMLSAEPADPSKTIAFSDDERLVAQFGRGDGMIYIFDTNTGKLLQSLGKKLEPDPNVPIFNDYHDVAFSRDGKFLASWSSLEAFIRLWDLATGAEITRFVPNETGAAATGTRGGQARIRLAWSPDGRVLALGENKIQLWELATLRIRRELPGHQDGAIRALAFSPRGQVLASASSDTTVLIWDMAMSNRSAPAEADLANGGLEQRWRTLATEDAAKAFAAILDLAAAPKQSLAWISAHVKPASPIAAKHIEKLIGDLNDVQFKTRQNASKELLQIGIRVLPALDKALTQNPTLETQRRLTDLRTRLTGPVLKNDVLRESRAVEVLERLRTLQARQLLQTLADGAPGAALTEQARAALVRWGE